MQQSLTLHFVLPNWIPIIQDRPVEYTANILASWVFKIKSNSASKECKEFLVQ